MKKMIFTAALAMGGLIAASAQTSVEGSKLTDNISIGVKGGVATPLQNGPFFGNMRGIFGLELRKQITPVFGLGVEGEAGVNTSSWTGLKSRNAIDGSYVGAFGTVNLNNLFAGYAGSPRVFEVEALLGAGWGHTYYPKSVADDYNFFATKAGLNLNFNLGETKAWTLSVKPAVVWNMNGGGNAQAASYYDANHAAFEITGGVTYHFKNSNGTHSFTIVEPYNQAEVDGLNAQVNNLRAEVAALAVANEASEANAAVLAAQLAACQERPVQVVKETSNTLSSVRYVFFRIGSAVITADQQPNVEMIAAYLKNHPKAKVVIKGYASADGNLEFNERLAKKRAESVKDSLIKKYKISSDRISAEGEGIGHMFKEESWNRVSICTIED